MATSAYDARRERAFETMTESIALEVHLQAFVRQDNSRRWAATCPLVGVASQGKTGAEARACLQEAVELWFESCVQRGVLDQALREANFKPAVGDRTTDRDVRDGVRKRANARNVLGDPFEIHLTIPAYEAATLLSKTA
jgi:predicted RNase H-like HicB family nuclease